MFKQFNMKDEEQQKPEPIKEDEVVSSNDNDLEEDICFPVGNKRRLIHLRVVLAKAISEGRAPTDEELDIY